MPAPPSKDGPRINEDIRVPRVLLIDEHGEKQGVLPTASALMATFSLQTNFRTFQPFLSGGLPIGASNGLRIGRATGLPDP